jgi:hypothetical protein
MYAEVWGRGGRVRFGMIILCVREICSEDLRGTDMGRIVSNRGLWR